MANNFLRLASANALESSLRGITQRNADLAALQENLTTGKRVVRPSDDPTAAAQAERALTRISRIQTEQRALEMQRNNLALSESVLGETISLVQEFRDLAVAAGNGANSGRERETLAAQMTALREQIFALSNRTDTNGLPLFGGLGSAEKPFTTSLDGAAPDPDYNFNGLAGQRSSSEVAVPFMIDGRATWMDVPETNGVFNVSLGATNTGRVFSDIGQVTDAALAAVDGFDYTISFATVAGVMTYTATNNTTAAVVTGNYKENASIQLGGIQIRVQGTPADGDTLEVNPNDPNPSNRPSVFRVLDRAIEGMYLPGTRKGADSTNANFNHELAISLAQIDNALEQLQRGRATAGDLLNRADRITSQQDERNVQLQSDRSRAEDLDMIAGISDFQNQQTAYSAALQSYAQIQRLSLFNFIG